MNLAKLLCFSIPLLILLSSCKRENNSSFAIRDFSKSLQPYLIEVVSKGIVGYDSSTEFIQTQATDNELEQLSKSEHPVLRTVAFRAMLKRKSFNHFDLIMSHLDDTAIVATDRGEFGIDYRTISDDMLLHTRFKDSASRDIVIDSVVLRHNYLREAYRICFVVGANNKYYVSIKEMAKREDNKPFEVRENALYALAAFKKNEDIQLIKEILLTNKWHMGFSSFRLMKEYPNDAYMEVFKAYYPRTFYHFICRRDLEDVDEHLDFLQSLASYKSDSSAAILNAIFNRKPFIPCFASPRDSSSLKWDLMRVIWDNRCPAYSKLRKQIEVPMKEDDKEKLKHPEIPYTSDYVFPTDTSGEPVRWW